MRSAPQDIDVKELHDILAPHWQLEADRLDYFPQGGGAYHWLVTSGDGRRFVTVDDLDNKPWLGLDRESVFAELLRAYQTALDLRREAGLSFVVAPEPAVSGDYAIRLSDRYSVALFPFVEGVAGRWAEPIAPAERTRLVGLLAQLHRATSAAHIVRRHHLQVPDRERFGRALAELDQPWDGGPFAEPTRQQLAEHLELIVSWLVSFDELAARVVHSSFEPVVTHGEPHPGNLIRTQDGYALIDWDTVALDRPERDLWMLDDATGTAWATYQELTGWRVDPAAATLYRLAWRLTDLAAFTLQLRAPHDRNPDTEKAWMAIRRTLALQEPFPYGQSA